ncbi:hydrolase [Deinococcus irradiatisoli]|uniref:Hydrolase n=1 Tax=Deinococcus irradiatisoli TaxID=2202254 RepID=A0A2Z3JN28_9DEIO|nr:Cof-type HAD-IIB family hydrolase [Deinococcus irradiatisoli]AWN22614.1 hydrolase [Deinococcus irradiatisoli]
MTAASRFRLVASDLDGTLLTSRQDVSARSRAALAAVQAAGGVVVLITGRPSRMVLPLAADLGLAGHVICSNGAAIHRLPGGEAEELRTLSPDTLRRAVPQLRRACPDLGLALEWGEDMQAETAYRAAPDSVADVLDVLDAGYPVLKVMARSTRRSPPALAELINAECGDDLHASLSGAPFAEIAARGVNKSAALARLCAALNVAPDEVIAFGDAPNDLPLLSWAGRGVAVANAVDEVKALADEVTLGHDEDGVAAVLERLLAGGLIGGSGG